MRTIELYKYEELSPKAQANARKEYMEKSDIKANIIAALRHELLLRFPKSIDGMILKTPLDGGDFRGIDICGKINAHDILDMAKSRADGIHKPFSGCISEHALPVVEEYIQMGCGTSISIPETEEGNFYHAVYGVEFLCSWIDELINEGLHDVDECAIGELKDAIVLIVSAACSDFEYGFYRFINGYSFECMLARQAAASHWEFFKDGKCFVQSPCIGGKAGNDTNLVADGQDAGMEDELWHEFWLKIFCNG